MVGAWDGIPAVAENSELWGGMLDGIILYAVEVSQGR